jgi:hypothetical protein
VSNFPTHSVIASNSNETGRGYPLLIKGGEWDPLRLRNDNAPHLLFWVSHSWYQ